VKIGAHTVSGSNIELTEKLQLAWFTEGTPDYDSWTDKNLNPDSPWTGYDAEIKNAGNPTALNIGKSQLSDSILLNYVSTNLDTAAVTASKWYYNASDGYFYYIGALNGGASTTQLLDKVVLSNTAPDTFRKVSYDLSVTVEAIQAVKAAVADGSNGGWNLSGDLLTKLQAACAE
jgi:hypothetical protein